MWLLQLKKRVRNLQHQDVRVVVLVAHQHTLARAAHAMLLVVLLQAAQTRRHGRILLRLVLLGAKCVVGQRVQPYRRRLVGVEVAGDDGAG